MENGQQKMAQFLQIACAIRKSRRFRISHRSVAKTKTSSSALSLASVIADLPQLVWVTNLNGQCIYVNNTFEKFVGSSADSFLNVSWANYLHPKDITTAMHSWQHSVRHKKSHQSEYRIRRYDNSYRRMLSRAVLIENADGSTGHWIGTNTEIHEVYENTSDLQKSFLPRRDLICALARDLQTPLNIIDISADLALDHPDDERRVVKYLRTILKNTDRLGAIVADLVDRNPI